MSQISLITYHIQPIVSSSKKKKQNPASPMPLHPYLHNIALTTHVLFTEKYKVLNYRDIV